MKAQEMIKKQNMKGTVIADKVNAEGQRVIGVRTNLSEWNRGICGSNNNSRYTGTTTVWGAMYEMDSTDGVFVAADIAFKTKAELVAWVDWLASSDGRTPTYGTIDHWFQHTIDSKQWKWMENAEKY